MEANDIEIELVRATPDFPIMVGLLVHPAQEDLAEVARASLDRFYEKHLSP